MSKLTFFENRHFIPGFLGLAGFLVVWELVTRSGLVEPIFISSPSQTIRALVYIFATGSIYSHLQTSGWEFILGFLLAVILGIGAGLILGWYKRLFNTSKYILNILYSTPNIALIPLIVIWFGIGLWSKVAVVFLGAFFPILISTISGVNNLDEGYIKLARSFGAKDLILFEKIILPSTLPSILSGIRIAIPRGLIGMIVGEFFASGAGLGYLMSFYGATFQTDKLFAVIVLIIIISLTLSKIVDILEKRFQSWKTVDGQS